MVKFPQTYCINYEYSGKIQKLHYSASDEKEANAMFKAIKEKGFWGGMITLNYSIDKKLKKKILVSFNGKHDCSIRSLLLVMPELDYERVRRVFEQCTQWYPYGAVTNNEFNMVLRTLGIFDKFEYGILDDEESSEDKTAWDFIEDKENTYIILFYGHFTVIDNGRIVDFFPVNLTNAMRERKVYRYWMLKK